ncbi:hypothetical protein SUGI_0424810 [Cryptomeria japonica]|uniref:protein EPIDERMAL PATTERNING FACTOR 2 n=1 Tax=Cryptomeria japonica TaxID=3369 RepID=UPI002408AD7F|nr:protein EPIDERMAL PATTERNING FACTOR 2 [Cryptomeria japonica]GLJ22569.1 hypothetical protein SUGI_0424810 [Cryptomeria japonica]
MVKVLILHLVVCLIIFSHQFQSTVGRVPPMVRLDDREIKKDTCVSSSVEAKARMLQVAGSSLPDCSHACEGCSPCIRVIVASSKCSIIVERAEACPVAYRCMCKGKSYPVPEN